LLFKGLFCGSLPPEYAGLHVGDDITRFDAVFVAGVSDISEEPAASIVYVREVMKHNFPSKSTHLKVNLMHSENRTTHVKVL
jgi:hypothetical protein